MGCGPWVNGHERAARFVHEVFHGGPEAVDEFGGSLLAMGVRVRLLGAAELEIDGEEVPLRGDPTRRLMAMLALNAGRELTRLKVAHGLWPKKSADQSLAQALKSLRDAIKEAGFDPDLVVRTTRGSSVAAGTIRLVADWVDAKEFERLAGSHGRDELERALDLYRGDLLEQIEDPYLELTRWREELFALAYRTRARLAETVWLAGDEIWALTYAADFCRAHPQDSETWAQLERYVAATGNLAAAEVVAGRLLKEFESAQLPATAEKLQKSIHRDGLPEVSEDDRRPTDRDLPAEEVSTRSARPPGRNMALVVGIAVIAVGSIVVAATLGDSASTVADTCDRAALTMPSREDLAVQGARPEALSDLRPEPEVDVGEGPATLAIAEEGIWVGQRFGIALIDPETMRQQGNMIQTDSGAFSLAVARDRIWATLRNGQLVSVDRDTRQLVGSPITYGGDDDAGDVVLGAGSVWVNNFGNAQTEGSVTRIDPCTGQAQRIQVGRRAATVDYGLGSVWVTDPRNGTVVRLDPETEEILETITGFTDPNDLLVTEDTVWVTEYAAKKLVALDPDTNEIRERFNIGSDPAGIAVGGGSLWIPLYGSGHLTRVDPEEDRSVIKVAKGGLSPTDAAVGFGKLWMANNGEDTVTPLASS